MPKAPIEETPKFADPYHDAAPPDPDVVQGLPSDEAAPEVGMESAKARPVKPSPAEPTRMPGPPPPAPPPTGAARPGWGTPDRKSVV